LVGDSSTCNNKDVHPTKVNHHHHIPNGRGGGKKLYHYPNIENGMNQMKIGVDMEKQEVEERKDVKIKQEESINQSTNINEEKYL